MRSTTGAGDSILGGVLCSLPFYEQVVEKMEWEEEIKKVCCFGKCSCWIRCKREVELPWIPTKETVFEFRP